MTDDHHFISLFLALSTSDRVAGRATVFAIRDRCAVGPIPPIQLHDGDSPDPRGGVWRTIPSRGTDLASSIHTAG